MKSVASPVWWWCLNWSLPKRPGSESATQRHLGSFGGTGQATIPSRKVTIIVAKWTIFVSWTGSGFRWLGRTPLPKPLLSTNESVFFPGHSSNVPRPEASQRWSECQILSPKSDQVQISPAASPEISHHTVWRTCLFIAYSDERWLYHDYSHYLAYTFRFKWPGEFTFWTWEWKGNDRAYCSWTFNPFTPKTDQFQISAAASPENITTQYGELAFHSLLRWNIIKLPILTTSRMRFSLKGWEKVLFELWEWKG